MKKGIISFGEALIDFIPTDSSNLILEKCAGGAPANVAVGTAKLGAETIFIGKVGDDVLGHFLKQTLVSYGVETDFMSFTNQTKTSLTFVTLDGNGERHFDFYINPGADQMIRADEITDRMFWDKKIFHFGSISMIHEPARTATEAAVAKAKEHGQWISYDPNLRLDLWPSAKVAKDTIISQLGKTDILKLSEEELTFLTGESKVEAGVKQLAFYEIPLIFITMGASGSLAYLGEHKVSVEALEVDAIDTTGAGDAYMSAILFGLNEYDGDLASLTFSDIERIASRAAISGGLAAASKGAMTALPTLSEINAVLAK